MTSTNKPETTTPSEIITPTQDSGLRTQDSGLRTQDSPPLTPEQTAIARRQALQDIQKIVGVDMKNSCEQVAHHAEAGNDALLKEAWALLLKRQSLAIDALELATGQRF